MTRGLTLQRALLGTVGAAILAGIVPAGIVLDRRLAATLGARARADLALAPIVFGDRQHVSADGMMMRAKEFSHSPALIEALARGDRRAVQRVAERARPGLGGTPVVVGPNGETWTGPSSAVVTSALVPRTRNGEMPVVTIGDGGSLQDVALAPVEQNGQWIGAAGLAILLDAEQAAVLGGLTRSDVVVIAAPRTLAASTIDAATHSRLLAAVQQLADKLPAIAAARPAPVYEFNVGRRRYIAAVALIANAGTVVFIRDLDAELAVLPQIRLIAFFSAIAALLSALIVGALLAARLARPVRQLALAADAIARGEFDGPLPAADRIGVREVARVAGAFGAMRAALAARLDELRETNIALADRTARLTALQADLVQRERLAATGRLVAQLAHEIRNPVASLRNCLELIRRRVQHDAEAREFADLAIDELLRMHELAEQMLDLDHPRDTAVGSCQPAQVARDVRGLLSAGAPANAAPIEFRLAHGTSGREEATIARDALKQVLLNLVQNAREAIAAAPRLAAQPHPRGEVVIEIAAGDRTVAISVSDTGPGIDAAHRLRIFDPFFTTKADMHGVGLGLFVAEGLVRSAGGRLTVVSPVDAPGVTFRAEIPLTVAPRAVAPAIPDAVFQGARS